MSDVSYGDQKSRQERGVRGKQIRPLPELLLPASSKLASGFPEDKEATLIKSAVATRGSRRVLFI